MTASRTTSGLPTSPARRSPPAAGRDRARRSWHTHTTRSRSGLPPASSSASWPPWPGRKAPPGALEWDSDDESAHWRYGRRGGTPTCCCGAGADVASSFARWVIVVPRAERSCTTAARAAAGRPWSRGLDGARPTGGARRAMVERRPRWTDRRQQVRPIWSTRLAVSAPRHLGLLQPVAAANQFLRWWAPLSDWTAMLSFQLRNPKPPARSTPKVLHVGRIGAPLHYAEIEAFTVCGRVSRPLLIERIQRSVRPSAPSSTGFQPRWSRPRGQGVPLWRGAEGPRPSNSPRLRGGHRGGLSRPRSYPRWISVQRSASTAGRRARPPRRAPRGGPGRGGSGRGLPPDSRRGCEVVRSRMVLVSRSRRPRRLP